MAEERDYYRFCPGEEHIKLSNAICLGRRRKNYPKCPGCQFNDDQRAGRHSSATGSSERMTMIQERSKSIESLFKAYDVRGIYPDPLDEDAAWRIGHATGAFLRASLSAIERGDPKACTVIVGRDMRKSSPSLAQNLIEGIRSCGASVVDIGMIDTSQIYFAINHLGASGGIQTTASHNPAHYNGFKISGKHAVPIGGDTGLKEISMTAQNMIRHDTGMEGDLQEVDLTESYRAFVRGFLKQPKTLKIVVDASNGMAGKWFPILFNGIPEIEWIGLNMEHEGEFVHEPNPLVESNLKQLREAVHEHQADLGVCFDGDADRCALVDEKSQIVRCDYLTALLAEYFLKKHPGATVVYDLRSSRSVPETIKAAGGGLRRERVGHAFMKKALSESKGIFGGELSGHFYFKDNFYCDSGMLAFVHTINALTETDAPLSSVIARYQRYANSGERNFKNPDAHATMRELAERYADGEVDYLDGITVQYDSWWFNVRSSNTEPLLRLNLEADTPKRMEEKLTELSKMLGTPVDH